MRLNQKELNMLEPEESKAKTKEEFNIPGEVKLGKKILT
jgi:hypothetical protein